MRSNFAFVFVLLDVASASFVENPDDDRPKLFVDATGIITKEFIADYIEILNSEELSALKDMSKTTDLAMLNEKLTTYNANLIQRVVDEMMYVKFNSMNQAQ
jgi:glutamine synthetase adenylyltransferase